MKLAKPIIGGREYNRIHNWFRRTYGLATRCESRSCDKKSQKFEWALKKGKEYEAKRENFKQLCTGCHRLYDFRYSNHGKYKPNRTTLTLDADVYQKLRRVAFKKNKKISVLVSEFVATL